MYSTLHSQCAHVCYFPVHGQNSIHAPASHDTPSSAMCVATMFRLYYCSLYTISIATTQHSSAGHSFHPGDEHHGPYLRKLLRNLSHTLRYHVYYKGPKDREFATLQPNASSQRYRAADEAFTDITSPTHRPCSYSTCRSCFVNLQVLLM